jgi:hypothetical protein
VIVPKPLTTDDIYIQGAREDASNQNYIRFDSGTGLTVYGRDSAADVYNYAAAGVFTINQWAVLGIVGDRSDAILAYKDGDAITLNESVAMTDADMDSNAVSYLGRRNTDYGNMELSIFRQFNLALDPTDATDNAIINGGDVPFKYAGASQTEVVYAASGATDNNTFTSDTGWWSKGGGGSIAGNVAVATTVTSGVSIIYNTTVLTSGKKYRVTYTVSGYSIGGVKLYLGGNFGTVRSVDGTYTEEIICGKIDTWLSLTADGTTTLNIDDVYVTQIGCVLDLNPTGITSTKWIDNSGNDLDGTVSGAIVTNPQAGLYIAEAGGDAKMYMDDAGNVGIGNSALESWDADWTSLQIGGLGAYYGKTVAAAGNPTYLSNNVYFDGTNKRIIEDEASRYGQQNGAHVFSVTGSAAADSGITWITAQTITSAGLTQFGTASGAGQVNITPASAINGLSIVQDNAASGLSIDQNSSNNAVTLNGTQVIYALQDGANGYVADFVRNVPEAGSSPMVKFRSANASNTQPTLFIDHNGTGGATGYGLHVDSENAAGPAVYIEGAGAGSTSFAFESTGMRAASIVQNTADGRGLYVRRNIAASTETFPLVYFGTANATDTKATLSLQNDGSGAHITTGATNEDLEIDPNGTGNVVITGSASVSGDSITIATNQSPAATDACTAGEVAWDASYVYICTASTVWKRAALTGGY